jgi:hypothetical protein
MEAAVLENEAMKLPSSDRAVLADRLLQSLGSLDPRIMQAWADEGEQRLASFRAGEIAVLDGAALTASLRAKFG